MGGRPEASGDDRWTLRGDEAALRRDAEAFLRGELASRRPLREGLHGWAWYAGHAMELGHAPSVRWALAAWDTGAPPPALRGALRWTGAEAERAKASVEDGGWLRFDEPYLLEGWLRPWVSGETGRRFDVCWPRWDHGRVREVDLFVDHPDLWSEERGVEAVRDLFDTTGCDAEDFAPVAMAAEAWAGWVQAQARWSVTRQDEQGNVFEVAQSTGYGKARRRYDALVAAGHKQTYAFGEAK